MKDYQKRPLENKTEEISQTCWSRLLCIKPIRWTQRGFSLAQRCAIKRALPLSLQIGCCEQSQLWHTSQSSITAPELNYQLKWLWAGDVSVTGLWKFIHFSCSGISKSARRSTDLLQGNTFFFIHRCMYTWQMWFDYNKLWCDCSVSVAHLNKCERCSETVVFFPKQHISVHFLN